MKRLFQIIAFCATAAWAGAANVKITDLTHHATPSTNTWIETQDMAGSPQSGSMLIQEAIRAGMSDSATFYLLNIAGKMQGFPTNLTPAQISAAFKSGLTGVLPLYNLTSLAQGDIIFFDGTDWRNLPAGTSGYYLQSAGPGANPLYAAISGGTFPPASHLNMGGFAFTNWNVAPIWSEVDAVAQYHADPTGVNDLGAILNQIMVDRLTPTNVGRILNIGLGDGIYVISNAPDSTNHCQVLYPMMTNAAVGWTMVRIHGVPHPPTLEGTSLQGPHSRAGTVIKTTLSSADCVFGSQFQGTTANYMTPAFEDITFEITNNFQGTFLECSNVVCARLQNVSAHHYLGNGSLTASAPPAGSVFFDGPHAALGNEAPYIDHVDVSYFEKGIRVSEHSIGHFLNIVGCTYGLVFKAGTLENKFDWVMLQNCQKNIAVEGQSKFQVWCNIEKSGGGDWRTSTDDLYDPSNQGLGFIAWTIQDNNNPANNHNFIRANGTGQTVILQEMTADAQRFINNNQSSTLWTRGPHWEYFDNSARGGFVSNIKFRGSSGSPAAAASGDSSIYTAGFYDGTSKLLPVWFGGTLDGSVSAGSTPGSYVVYTGVNSAPTNRLTVASSGAATWATSVAYPVSTGGSRTLTQLDQFAKLNVDGGTLTLPSAVGANGRPLTCVLVSPATTGSVATQSGQLIGGAASPYSLTTSNKFVVVWSDNANWWISSSN